MRFVSGFRGGVEPEPRRTRPASSRFVFSIRAQLISGQAHGELQYRRVLLPVARGPCDASKLAIDVVQGIPTALTLRTLRPGDFVIWFRGRSGHPLRTTAGARRADDRAEHQRLVAQLEMTASWFVDEVSSWRIPVQRWSAPHNSLGIASLSLGSTVDRERRSGILRRCQPRRACGT